LVLLILQFSSCMGQVKEKLFNDKIKNENLSLMKQNEKILALNKDLSNKIEKIEKDLADFTLLKNTYQNELKSLEMQIDKKDKEYGK